MCPRDSGRSWHTDSVKPGKGCGLPPAMSADSVPTWNWMSGVASSGRDLLKMPTWPAPMVSGPELRNSHSSATPIFFTGLRARSLKVIGNGQR